MNTKFTFIDLFAGIGGIRLVFESIGGRCVFSSEFDEDACKTYEANFNEHPKGDITKIPSEEIPDFDILLAGFPCQAFSIAGYRKGFEDERGRGKLFFEMLRFIDAYKPKALFFENVRNLQSHNKGETYKAIEQALADRGYHVCARVLDTCEYSKLPQHRERFYMVCFKNKKHAELFEKYGWPKKVPAEERSKFWEIIDETADDIHYFSRYPHYYKPAMELIKSSGNEAECFYQWRRVYCRKNKNGVCPTLTANMGGGGHNVPLVMDKKGLRRLTPAECLRLQGIDDKKFVFPDDISIGAKYKQIGNAVSVPVVEEIAKGIMKILTVPSKDIVAEEE